jgi:propionyl-CoA synthetase
MLACTRIGALHSVVFGGFASVSLASRIDDASPRSSSAPTPAAAAARWCPTSRCSTRPSRWRSTSRPSGADGRPRPGAVQPRGRPRRRLRRLRAKHLDAQVPCVWVDATHPSYTLYTSGTTGKPKGVQRDTGGYAWRWPPA